MTEHQLYDPADPPDFFIPSWYDTREHAPHLEQGAHVTRLKDVAVEVHSLVAHYPDITTISDLGAGDGGLLSLLSGLDVERWGYDLSPANVAYAQNTRGVTVHHRDFEHEEIQWGVLTIITECLEHLPDPHAAVRRISRHSRFIVASSPAFETYESHDACHAWAWDLDGYRALIEQGGFQVIHHALSDPDGYGFQVIVGVQP
jgi:hypothetical protein